MLSQPNIASVVHSSECTIHFGSPACPRLLYCCGLYTARFSSVLLIFVCLPKTEVCRKNSRCHVQSVLWSLGYTTRITKFETIVFREQKRSTFVYCYQNFIGTSCLCFKVQVAYLWKRWYLSTKLHGVTYQETMITLCTGVCNCNSTK